MRFKSKGIWDLILEKRERILAGWKKVYYSKGGQITLIKSTLSSLTAYFLSLFPLLASITHCKKFPRDFLWGGFDDAFKFHLVSWKMICKLVQQGSGLLTLFKLC